MSKQTETYLERKGNRDYKYGQRFKEIYCVKEWQLTKGDVGSQRLFSLST